MKLLLALGTDETYNNISRYVKPLGFELIRYNHVIKAMDNIDEIDPSAIIISARDYPRHWKTMVQFVRAERTREDCPIIILRGENFPVEESTKASFLGVSGIVKEPLDDPQEIEDLKVMLGHDMPADDRRQSRRLSAELGQKFSFVFAHPNDKTLVTGKIKNISLGGLSFLPDNPSQMRDIILNMELKECSLRVGDALLSPICRLARTSRIVSLMFVSFPGDEQKIINEYMESIPKEELSEDENGRVEITIM